MCKCACPFSGFSLYSQRGDGWMAFCLFAVSLLRCFVFFCFFFFFSIRQITRHAIYSSLLGVVLITCWGFQTWKIHIAQLLFHKCWVARQSSAMLNQIHAWNLYKRSVSHKGTRHQKAPVQKYGRSLNSDLLERRPPLSPWATFHRSGAKTKHTAFPFRREHTQQSIFCPMTSNPPEIWWHFIDGLHLAGRLRNKGRWERREEGEKEEGWCWWRGW